MSLPTIFNPKIPTSLHTLSPSKNFTSQKLHLFPKNLHFTTLKPSSTFHFTTPQQQTLNGNDNDNEEQPIGDCVVFEEGIFEDPFGKNELGTRSFSEKVSKLETKRRKNGVKQVKEENLVPDEWREVQAELSMSKKDRRKIAREVEFGSRVLRKKQGLVPLRDVNLEEYSAFKEAKTRQLKPIELDDDPESEDEGTNESVRVEPKNPKWAVYGRGLNDVTEFFNSESYVPDENKPRGRQKMFTKEEKIELSKKIPDLAPATSGKWLPLHALAASGEFYLTNALLKHNVDINATDKDGMTALHKAIIAKKQAITNYLLKESADPFVRDKDGATLIHYAVQTGSIQAIKVLLLYNVDINLQDNDGWTPLHLAVQARRTDVVRLLLIKGANKTLKNKDGLTPLDLCLYSGRDTRTYELIKMLKTLPKSRNLVFQEAQS